MGAALTEIVIDAADPRIGQGDQTGHVLADPEGNEFCLLRTRVG